MSYNITEQARAVLDPLIQYGAMLNPQIRVLDCTAADETGDGSWARPFKTFQQALNARPTITADQKTWSYTVLVQPGVYPKPISPTVITVLGDITFVAMGSVIIGDVSETTYTTKIYVQAGPVGGPVGATGNLNFTSLRNPQGVLNTASIAISLNYSWNVLGDFVVRSVLGNPFNMNLYFHGVYINEDPDSNTRGLYVENPALFAPGYSLKAGTDQCYFHRVDLSMVAGNSSLARFWRSWIKNVTLNGGMFLLSQGVYAFESRIDSLSWNLDVGTLEATGSVITGLVAPTTLRFGPIKDSQFITPAIADLRATTDHGPVTNTVFNGGAINGGFFTRLLLDANTNYWIKAGPTTLVSVTKVITDDFIP